MKQLNKPTFSVKEIVEDCAMSYTNTKLRQRLTNSSEYISAQSDEYDKLSNQHCLEKVLKEALPTNVSKKEMVDLYDKKFVGNAKIKDKYYNKIMIEAKGKCPICGIGQASTLDHYLAKTIYPMYSVTPLNLVPVCKDCNYNKRDSEYNSIIEFPLNPYYDNVDNTIWLEAELMIKDGSLCTKYRINEAVEVLDKVLYKRLQNHFALYKLSRIYSIQAATEISENASLWKKYYAEWGESTFYSYITDCLHSYEKVQYNTWKTALYRAISNNVGIISLTNTSS